MKILSILFLFSVSAHATIVIPSFYTQDPNARIIRSEQNYDERRIEDIFHQMNFWSFYSLPASALSQALNDVFNNNGKFSGVVEREVTKNKLKEYNLYHASAGKGQKTATIFFICENNNTIRIIGIGKHVPVKRNQDPVYHLVSWDDRYKRRSDDKP